MDHHKIYKKTEDYVTGLFEQMPSPDLIYHNLEHTKDVVKHTNEIAGHYKVSEKDMLILYIAAWFHDIGHLFTEPAKHEEMSVEVMKNFMKDEDETVIDAIAGCIIATKSPRNPKNLLEEIICDADTYHFGTKKFKETNKLVYEEYQLRDFKKMSMQAFNEGALKMMKAHKFYTSYCRDLLDEKKQKNIEKLEEKVMKKEKEKQPEKAPEAETGTLANLEKDKSGLMSKGIQTMLRLASENHLKLSEMADHKANILISVNSIIISVILSLLLRKLQENTYLAIPTSIFLLVAVATIVVSILSTRPKITGGKFTEEDIKQKKTNLLFFGNFYRASYDQYNSAMREMMLDTDYLYGSLIKDIYYLGVVLGHKYKLIRLAYNIFMVGIIASVLAFAIAFIFYGDTSAQTAVNGSPFN